MPLPSHEAMESPKEPMQWLQGRTKLMHPFSSHGGHALSMSKHPGSILPMRSAEDEIPVDEELAMPAELSMSAELSTVSASAEEFAADELLISRLLQDSDGSQVQMTGDESLSQALRARAIADTAVSPQAILDKFFFMMLLLISPIHFP